MAAFDYGAALGKNVFAARLVVTPSAGASGTHAVNAFWADEYGPHISRTPRRIPPPEPYSYAWYPYLASSVTHPGSAQTLSSAGWRDLFNSWSMSSSSGGAVLFTGDETAGVYTLKKFSATLQLDYQDPAPVTTISSPASGSTLLSTVADPAGLAHVTATAYESAGTGFLRRTQRTLPAYASAPTTANSATYAYFTSTANPSTCTNGVGVIGLAWKTTSPTPSGGSAIVHELAYDSMGRVAGSRTGTDAWTCTTYDARGRITQVTVPAGGNAPGGGSYPARTVAYQHTAGGNPRVTDVCDGAVTGGRTGTNPGACATSTGTITTTVDLLGRTSAVVDVWNKTTSIGYDQAGRAISSTAFGGTIATGYDDANRPTTVTVDSTVQATATYTPGGDGGELDTVTYANGTTLAPVTRDVAGRTTTLKFKAGATTRVKSTVTRSQSGRVLTDTTDPGGLAVAYTYDTVGRLVRANGNGHDYSYCYDQTIANCAAGHVAATGKNTNRTTLLDGAGVVAGYTYDPADRLTATTQSGYTGTITYDGHGNTTAVGGQTLYYDLADRHQATTRQTVTATYQRDVTDRIVARTSTSTGLIKYAHTGAGDATDAVLDSSGNVVQRLIPLPGGVIYTKKTAGGATWSYPNIHGDVALTTDGAGAVTSGPHTYDPYGNNLTPAGSAPNNVNGQLDYRWVGQHQRFTEGEPPSATPSTWAPAPTTPPSPASSKPTPSKAAPPPTTTPTSATRSTNMTSMA